MHTDQAAAATPLMSEEEVGRRVVPVIVGGTFLAYAYVREFNRRYGTTRCIVIITQDVKMLTSSKFTDCRIVPDAAHPEGLYRALEDIASELRAEDPETVPLLLGCDDRHALMFAAAQEHLRDEGFVVACNNYTMLAKISQKRGFYELCEELDIPYPKTWYFNCGENGPETLPVDEFPYPCIAKPSDTTKFQNANVAHKRKAYEIDSPKSCHRSGETYVPPNTTGSSLFRTSSRAAMRLCAFSTPSARPMAICASFPAASPFCKITVPRPWETPCASWATRTLRSSIMPEPF